MSEPMCECGHNVQLHGMNGCYSCNQPTMEKLAKGWCQEFRDTRLAARDAEVEQLKRENELLQERVSKLAEQLLVEMEEDAEIQELKDALAATRKALSEARLEGK